MREPAGGAAEAGTAGQTWRGHGGKLPYSGPTMRRRSLLLALLAAAGCSSTPAGGHGDPSDLASPPAGADLSGALALADLAGPGPLLDLAAVPPDLFDPRAVYPAGPYGADVGSVVRNFSWPGYLDLDGSWPASGKPFGAVSLEAIRRGGGRYLFIATGAYW